MYSREAGLQEYTHLPSFDGYRSARKLACANAPCGHER